MTEADTVVGCMHKLRQPWQVHGEIHDVPAMHNHYVDEAYRRGPGLQLMIKSLANDYGVLAPGCEPKVGDIYRKLRRYTEIQGTWFRTVRRPIHTMIKFGLEKWWPQPMRTRSIQLPTTQGPFQFTTAPDAELLQGLVESYSVHAAVFDVKQHYTPDGLTWRFFSPVGPQHVLVHHRAANGMLNFLIVSIGQHRGVTLARIVEGAFTPEAFPGLHEAAQTVLRMNHVDVVATFTADPVLKNSLETLGLKAIPAPPQTFVYFASPVELTRVRLNGAAGDFGLDAIPRTWP